MLEQNKTEYSGTQTPSTAVMLRNGLFYFGVGATIGAALALLFAPKSGVELRGDIADASRKGYDVTLEKAMEMKEQSAEAIQAVKEKAATVYDFAVEKITTGTDAVNDVVSATTGAVKEGLDHLTDDSTTASSRGSSRRPSSVM